jgi:hypothetical protein
MEEEVARGLKETERIVREWICKKKEREERERRRKGEREREYE